MIRSAIHEGLDDNKIQLISGKFHLSIESKSKTVQANVRGRFVTTGTLGQEKAR